MRKQGTLLISLFSFCNMLSNPQVLLNLTPGPLTSPPANMHNLSLLFTIILIYQTNIQFVLVPDLLLCPRRVISRPNCVAKCFVDSETCSPSLSTTSAPATGCPAPSPKEPYYGLNYVPPEFESCIFELESPNREKFEF